MGENEALTLFQKAYEQLRARKQTIEAELARIEGLRGEHQAVTAQVAALDQAMKAFHHQPRSDSKTAWTAALNISVTEQAGLTSRTGVHRRWSWRERDFTRVVAERRLKRWPFSEWPTYTANLCRIRRGGAASHSRSRTIILHNETCSMHASRHSAEGDLKPNCLGTRLSLGELNIAELRASQANPMEGSPKWLQTELSIAKKGP